MDDRSVCCSYGRGRLGRPDRPDIAETIAALRERLDGAHLKGIATRSTTSST